MNQSFNPDELNLSKQEILDYLGLVVIRWKNNPKVHGLMIKKFQADLKLMKYLVSEQDIRYNWQLFRELVDGLYAINARKYAPELQRINDLNQAGFIRKVCLPPEVARSELDVMRIMAQAKASLMYARPQRTN